MEYWNALKNHIMNASPRHKSNADKCQAKKLVNLENKKCAEASLLFHVKSLTNLFAISSLSCHLLSNRSSHLLSNQSSQLQSNWNQLPSNERANFFRSYRAISYSVIIKS